MGNFVCIEVSSDQTVDRFIRFLRGKGYIRNLKKNLRDLEREMEDLRAIKDEVQNKVAREETRHQQRLKAVQVWLTRVDSIDLQIKSLLSTCPVELQKLCLCGLCSKYVCSSYNYGKSVFLLLEEVKNLKSEGNFEVVAEEATTSKVEERPTQSTIGQDKLLQMAWNRLMEDGVGIMGLHGMGGVGKTTLFKKIHNKFSEMAGGFDVVIWIVVSQGAKTSKIQEDIAQKLHLCGDEWINKNETDKAGDIYSFLKGKRFVLMLDDIWEKVDLEAIGVPYPTRENGSKVAFTTRSLEVCGRMGDHEPIQVNCLEPDDAWELFKNKVGYNSLRRDPSIIELAKKVAEKCRGLPLALSVIGEAMASKTMVQEWEHAIDVLTTSAAEFSDMENKILSILKYSYDNLVDEHIKSCFLYCALMELHEVPKVKDWGAVRRMSLMTNNITEITCKFNCSRLITLFLQNNNLKNFSGEFIRSMKELAVLDLSCNSHIIELPEYISELTSLRFLDLSGTSITHLPVGFQELKKLIHLNLAYTKRLCSINGISKLPSLRVLKLQDSNVVHGYVSLVKKLQLLEHLQVLTISLSTDLGLEQISGVQRLANCINSVQMHKFQQKPLNISLLVNMENLCELRMLYTHVSEMNSYKNFRERRKNSSDLYNPTSPCFSNLSLVNIFYCNGIKDLTWLLFAPNLVELRIVRSEELEEIINKEKATNLTGMIPFLKLESLRLNRLPKLESIYWSPLPFPFLRELTAQNCPKLRKLPLNATSVPQVEEFVIYMDPREQGNGLEWEDEDTKNRFLSSINLVINLNVICCGLGFDTI
ncbi:hypothetical protein CARUB_v10019813mg [Capsella rubella]|uniref:Uncharacterized protein n=1 Tax=Capsella rubella TaxID=81985 RepID=R0I5I7_9BRAS|nr:hypothetical protein CARUB_v10019813mg [Capsella rubella]